MDGQMVKKCIKRLHIVNKKLFDSLPNKKCSTVNEKKRKSCK